MIKIAKVSFRSKDAPEKILATVIENKFKEELCSYCPCTEYGQAKVNTGPHNMCEGFRCDDAYENYKESWER